ncbi:MAG: lipid-A-disaccharide synthase [Vulcanimicrobiaceae bacterium]
MRYFFSTGEPSGELSAVLLARAIARIDPSAQFDGIGADRMRANGFRVWHDTAGWASIGPLAAIPRIPPLLIAMLRTAARLSRNQPDLIVLVDFGAFNMRLAKRLRGPLKYRGPILYFFPPATWLDRPGVARAVADMTVPLTAFEHQREFYRSLDLPVAYFGHPLLTQYDMRPARGAPPPDGGCVALLPGSRSGELRYHLPALAAAYRELKAKRPKARAVFGAADARGERSIRAAIARERLADATVVRGVRDAVAGADAAWVASGTAVLEAALLGVPCVALYIITPLLVRQGRRMIVHRYITLPNLILDRAVVPELLQEEATPDRLAAEMDAVLRDPKPVYDAFVEMRVKLGAADAIDRCARFAVDLARGEPVETC